MKNINMKKTEKIILLGVLMMLVAVGFYIFSAKKTSEKNVISDSTAVSAPFANMVIPADYDEATRAVIQEKIDGIKKEYEEKPDIWEVWISIGGLKTLLKDYAGAIAAYRQSIVLYRENTLGYRGIAEVYNQNLKDYKKAEEYYKLALENNPGDVEVYITLAVLQYYRLNDAKAAETTFITGLARAQNNEEIIVRLIRFYNTIGDKAKEKNTAKLLLQLHPDNEAYQKEWGGL